MEVKKLIIKQVGTILAIKQDTEVTLAIVSGLERQLEEERQERFGMDDVWDWTGSWTVQSYLEQYYEELEDGQELDMVDMIKRCHPDIEERQERFEIKRTYLFYKQGQ